ncbi:hypothetical protein QE152_g4308 [Popillia japonica]|uniref:Uncharacterized protein n=1 Tax=Popillia japonica TaxID=7064 RepID=A0AAW1N188_POPJA
MRQQGHTSSSSAALEPRLLGRTRSSSVALEPRWTFGLYVSPYRLEVLKINSVRCWVGLLGQTSSSSAALEHRSVSSYRLEVLKISYTDVKRLDRPRITSDLSTRIGARIGLVFKIGTS